VKLESVERREISQLREERLRGLELGIIPAFHLRLAEEAEPYLVTADAESHAPVAVGYALLLQRPHDGHNHATLIELYLVYEYRTRYEDVLDLIRDELKPTAYLARTDDCLLNATLLARGLQVEATALVLLPETEQMVTAAQSHEEAHVELARFDEEHLESLRPLLEEGRPSAGHTHSHGDTTSVLDMEMLEDMALEGKNWVILREGTPVGVIARTGGSDGVHQLLDFVLARAPDESLAEALDMAGWVIRSEGDIPAAVIDAGDVARQRLFRSAGFYSAAAYMVFYDPIAGRPSVATISLAALQALIQKGEKFRLVDVLGEEHWREAHIPGSEWIDFRGLAREARRRFKTDEPIVLYCNGFT